MPNYKGHLAGGCLAFGAVYCAAHAMHIQPHNTLEVFLSALCGSLFPDIDTKSQGQRLFYMLFFIIYCMLFMQGAYFILSIMSFACLLPLLVHHRGLFHNIWFIVLLPAVVAGIALHAYPSLAVGVCWNSIFFCAGALSHLWLDFGIRKVLRIR